MMRLRKIVVLLLGGISFLLAPLAIVVAFLLVSYQFELPENRTRGFGFYFSLVTDAHGGEPLLQWQILMAVTCSTLCIGIGYAVASLGRLERAATIAFATLPSVLFGWDVILEGANLDWGVWAHWFYALLILPSGLLGAYLASRKRPSTSPERARKG